MSHTHTPPFGHHEERQGKLTFTKIEVEQHTARLSRVDMMIEDLVQMKSNFIGMTDELSCKNGSPIGAEEKARLHAPKVAVLDNLNTVIGELHCCSSAISRLIEKLNEEIRSLQPGGDPYHGV